MLLGTIWRGLLVGYYRLRLRRVGRRFRIGIGSVILNPERVFVGDDVFMGSHTLIGSPTEVYVGNRVMFGPRVTLIGGDHDVSNYAMPLRLAPPPPSVQPIVIEDDVWIGAGAIVLKGVRIGCGAVVGAGTIVTKDVPPGAVVVGNPARIARLRIGWDQWKKDPRYARLLSSSSPIEPEN
jgi:acetyltransferase-like isoleucine patch superfamily enzyme